MPIDILTRDLGQVHSNLFVVQTGAAGDVLDPPQERSFQALPERFACHGSP